MKKLLTPFKRQVTAVKQELAYAPPSRRLARRVISDPQLARVRRTIGDRGLSPMLNRVASPSLPEGMFYAKLTIQDWEKHDGTTFRLLQGGEVVYGNQIEPPAEGFPLEYRNIPVTSENLKDFHLDIDAPFTLKIGRGAFTTPQQVAFDEQYGVQQHGDVYYSVRGNTTNPSRILFTFPGFGPSTSRVSYAVSYLKQLTDEDLSDTLMVCFQDRYMVSGTYMLCDSGGEDLVPRVAEVIESFRAQHEIPQERLMFFGASKGGSIATVYAEPYPASHLLVVVPQMNLPYYLDKPFFSDSLYRVEALHTQRQPLELMRTYLEQSRRIDYFYTDDDEQSNYSLIELAGDVENLTKYRVDGAHSDVAKKTLPTVLSIMRDFAGSPTTAPDEVTAACDQIVHLEDPSAHAYQVRLGTSAAGHRRKDANIYLSGDLGRTRFHQLLTKHTYPFIAYTTPSQQLQESLHPVSSMTAFSVVTSHCPTVEVPAREIEIVPAEDGETGTSTPAALSAPLPQPLDLRTAGARFDYSVIRGAQHGAATFDVEVLRAQTEVGPRPTVLVLDSDAALPDVDEADSPAVVLRVPEEHEGGLALIVRRIVVQLRSDVVSLHVRTDRADSSELTRLAEDPRIQVIDGGLDRG